MSSGNASVGGRRLRILVTTPPVERPGGVANYLRVLRAHLSDEVDYFTIGSRSDRGGMLTTAWRMFRDSASFTVAVSRGGYDVVHLNPSIGHKALIRDGILLLIAKTLGKRVVVFAHGWDPGCYELLTGSWSIPFRWVFGRADAFIVLANEFKSKLMRLGYKKPIHIESAPLEDELLRYAEQHDSNVSRAPGKFTILFLARVEKEKGIYEALKTFRLVKLEHPMASLVIAGDGAELAAAVRHSEETGLADVTFVGQVDGDKKYQAFRDAEAYLFPSHTEGLPLSVLEAMAFGLPIVATAVGGLCDFFKDGTMGFMTASPDPEAMAGAIGRLIADPELGQNIGAFNRNYASTHFRGPQIATDIERIYRLVLEGSHRTLLPATGSLEL